MTLRPLRAGEFFDISLLNPIRQSHCGNCSFSLCCFARWSPLYLCLHPGCDMSYPSAEALDEHVGAHFGNQFAALEVNINHLHHPLDSAAFDHGFNDHCPTFVAFKSSASGSTSTINLPAGPSFSINGLWNGQTRPTCPRCRRTFGRTSDLGRHSKKHQRGTSIYQCLVVGCKYKGSYRKDKLDAHKRNCHGVRGGARLLW